MKVGDYVRLPDGIHKIKHYEYKPDYENCHCMYLDDNDYGLLFTNKDLIKSSPNIIDLIEVGDYVNGHYVREVELTPNEEVYKVIWTSTCDGMDGETLEIHKEEIESIVTKEQFSSMEYKIGE